ncbi:hybrid sensor histidine kinase/response regulator [Algoriphagus namhaensis]
MERSKIRILHVDDDPDDFLLVKSLLKSISYPAYELENALDFQEAIDRLDEGFDVFLVDFKLGKETGLDLIKEIKEKQPHAPVLMLTGMNTHHLDQEALALGATGYLIKGEFDSGTLDRTLRYALRDSMIMHDLDQAGRKFRSIFELAGDSFILINSQAVIVEANPIFIKKFGIDPHGKEEEGAHLLTECFVDEKAKDHLHTALSEDKELFEFEARLQAADGTVIEGLIGVTNQEADLFHVLIKDLSALKNREEEEYNLRKFSSTGRMARMLAHEVKNPLTTILLSADQLQMELPEAILEESGDLIKVIQRNCNRINQLVTQLLESTRFTELDIATHSVNTLLDKALEMVQDRLEIKNISLVKEYEEGICEVAVDGEKVKIALVNLMVNAIEAMEPNVGELRIKSYLKNDLCKIKITDNGCGISKENLDRLFEPFFTSKEGGSGLGLTNTQNIILSHNGSLRVNSQEGKGTTFTIGFNLSTPA